MQVPVYVATTDYETLGKHKPQEFKTVPQWISNIINAKANECRANEIIEA